MIDVPRNIQNAYRRWPRTESVTVYGRGEDGRDDWSVEVSMAKRSSLSIEEKQATELYLDSQGANWFLPRALMCGHSLNVDDTIKDSAGQAYSVQAVELLEWGTIFRATCVLQRR